MSAYFRTVIATQTSPSMESSDPSGMPPQPFALADTTKKPPVWRTVDTTQTSQPSNVSNHLGNHPEATWRWSAVQHDFERRLGRYGIKISEAKSALTSDAPKLRGGHPRAGAHAIIDSYSFDGRQRNPNPLASTGASQVLDASTLAHFTNNRRESELETAERQLQQARVEANIWKEKYEAQGRNLRQSYNETMEWRMKYEDLYSAVIQNQIPQPVRGRREGAKSLG